jgi:hypothetical protein
LGFWQKARGYCSSVQAIPGNAWTKAQVNTISFDPSGIVDTTNYRIKPTKAGYYQINANVLVNVSLDFVAIYRNGGLYAYAGGAETSAFVSDIVYCNGVSDYVEMWAYLPSAGSIEPNGAENYLSLVGPF